MRQLPHRRQAEAQPQVSEAAARRPERKPDRDVAGRSHPVRKHSCQVFTDLALTPNTGTTSITLT